MWSLLTPLFVKYLLAISSRVSGHSLEADEGEATTTVINLHQWLPWLLLFNYVFSWQETTQGSLSWG